jgi:hypothetical protein
MPITKQEMCQTEKPQDTSELRSGGLDRFVFHTTWGTESWEFSPLAASAMMHRSIRIHRMDESFRRNRGDNRLTNVADPVAG